MGEYRDDRFFPTSHGRMSWVGNTYFAPEALVGARGRQIMWAWLTDNAPGEDGKGWSGVYVLPRTLWLGEDGTLRMRPVPELERLRLAERSWIDLALDPGQPLRLRALVDRSVVEVYANDRQAIGRRVYPTRRDTLGVIAFVDGGEGTALRVRAWEMAAANPY